MSENATTQQIMLPKHGEFCWTEIASTNLEACKDFYANVFGWEMQKSANTGDAFEYAEFNLPTEYPMGGMYQISAEMFGEHLPPPHFLSYISVDDVDETTRQAFDLGAKIIKPMMDVPNVGKMSIVQDPTGAMIAFITLKQI
jgi:uncharacterized protein